MVDYEHLRHMDIDEAIEQLYRVPGGIADMISFVTIYTDVRYGHGTLRAYFQRRGILPRDTIISRLADMMTEVAPDKKQVAATLYRIQNEPTGYYDITDGYIDCDESPIDEMTLEKALMEIASSRNDYNE